MIIYLHQSDRSNQTHSQRLMQTNREMNFLGFLDFKWKMKEKTEEKMKIDYNNVSHYKERNWRWRRIIGNSAHGSQTSDKKLFSFLLFNYIELNINKQIWNWMRLKELLTMKWKYIYAWKRGSARTNFYFRPKTEIKVQTLNNWTQRTRNDVGTIFMACWEEKQSKIYGTSWIQSRFSSQRSIYRYAYIPATFQVASPTQISWECHD